MQVASVTALKANLSRYLRVVKRGGEVQVQKRGVPVARLVAAVHKESDRERLARLVKAGIVTPGLGPVHAEWLRKRPPTVVPKGSFFAALEAERKDRV